MTDATLGSSTAPDPWKQYIWTPDSPEQVSAALLSRLTEAADGYRTGEPVWFIASLARGPNPPRGHKVFGPFRSAREAWDRRGSGTEWSKFRIFGPFHTERDPNYAPRATVKEVLITLSNDEQVRLAGTECDCIFWTLSALDKFVVPYYTGIASLEEAMDVRKEFVESRTFGGIHIPSSEMVSADSTPQVIRLTGSEGLGLHLIVRSAGNSSENPVDFLPV
ncbi:hypothetical protein [Longimicrobium sp.]|jgi:hypothetical protein|uniref:hypothetical protein n=1 Tax=Longimicrobium sp. TaxID=2029185 RepID=UPI002EDA9743